MSRAWAWSVVGLLFLLPASASAEGLLLARGPEGEDRGSFPLTRTEVRGEVSGQVVSVDVTQRFENTFSERIEAVYVFPLPDEAAVDEMEMRIGPRTVRADVRPRGEAREMYDRAVQSGQRAALLEQERPNVFTFSVANIDPGTAIDVRLHYFEVAKYEDGNYELIFPMVVGPRYFPGSPLPGRSGTGTHPDTDRVDDASRVSPAYMPPGLRSGHTIGLSMKIDAGAPIERLEAPAHDVEITRPGDAQAVVSLRDRNEIPNRDFVLRWRLLAPELRTAVFAHRSDDESPGYVAILLEPRHQAPASEIAPREIFFLLDTSGSMSGAPLQTAVAAIRRALATLNPSDTFQIIDFADSASSFARRPLANTPANVERATTYLGHLQASGGTNQLAGIHAALSAPGDPERLRHVVFMTDGYLGNESEVIGLVQREIGRARIFGFGIGSSVNRYLLDEVSLAGRGAAEYLRPNEDAAVAIERFYRRIGRPYLTDIEVSWGGLRVAEVLPSPIPDLSTFQPLVLFARYEDAGQGTLTIRGRLAGRPFERSLSVSLPATERSNQAISRIWARAKISGLTRETHRSGETTDLVSQIMAVALEHHLVSRYTSLVAIDEVPVAPGQATGPRQIAQPAEAPEGVDVVAAGGHMVHRQVLPVSAGGEGESMEDDERHESQASGELLASPPASRAGCASCAVSSDRSDGPVVALLLMALGWLALRRRRG